MTEQKPQWYLDMIAELDAEIRKRRLQLLTEKVLELIREKLKTKE